MAQENASGGEIAIDVEDDGKNAEAEEEQNPYYPLHLDCTLI